MEISDMKKVLRIYIWGVHMQHVQKKQNKEFKRLRERPPQETF